MAMMLEGREGGRLNAGVVVGGAKLRVEGRELRVRSVQNLLIRALRTYSRVRL